MLNHSFFCVLHFKQKYETEKNRSTLIDAQEKTTFKRLSLLKQLSYLGIILIGSSFTACEKNQTDFKPGNVFPAISNKVILDWNATALNTMETADVENSAGTKQPQFLG